MMLDLQLTVSVSEPVHLTVTALNIQSTGRLPYLETASGVTQWWPI